MWSTLSPTPLVPILRLNCNTHQPRTILAQAESTSSSSLPPRIAKRLEELEASTMRTSPIQPMDLPPVVPVIHSSAYRMQQEAASSSSSSSSSPSSPSKSTKDQNQETTRNAVEWALRRADDSLRDVESSRPELAVAVYQATQSTVGKLLGKVAREASRATFEVSKEAATAALPLIRVAAKKSVSLAADALKKSLVEQAKGGKEKKDDRGEREGGGGGGVTSNEAERSGTRKERTA